MLEKKYPDIMFLIAGNGPRYDDTVKKAGDMGTKNVRIIPIQPREKYVKLLAASDVALVTLDAKVLTPVVPSKMLSIMSAGRPVLAALPLSGDAPGFIKRAGCGIVVGAGDESAFTEAIVKLYGDPALRESFGKRGREHVMANYSLAACAAKYEEIFKKMAKS